MNDYKKKEKICYIIGVIIQLVSLIIFFITDKADKISVMLFFVTGFTWYALGISYQNKSKDDSNNKKDEK